MTAPPLRVTLDEPVTNPAGPPRARAPESSIRLELLGGVALRDHAGEELTGVLAQPKRLALLAYLATGPGRRPRRRDSILGLLWPESDEARARNALNRSLSFLRGWLGNGVIVSRGKDEVGTAPERLWCDAAAFDEAVAREDFAAALDLYAGNLLEGFYVTGAPELESWVERERSRLRRLASTAAWTLAARAEQEGDFEESLRRARRALELDLFDEPALRRLLTLLDRAGDRLGAARVYADFERLLERDYEMEPSPETRALMETVRSRVSGHAEESGARWAPATGGAAVLAPPAPAEPRAREAPPAPVPGDGARASTPDTLRPVTRIPERSRRRSAVAALRRLPLRPRLAIGGVLAALALVSALALRAVVSSAEAPESGPPLVLVLPFAHTGDAEVEFLSAGAVTILGGNLQLPGTLRTVEPAEALRLAQRRLGGARGQDAARQAAARLGARYVVWGDVTSTGGRVRVEAYLADTRGATAWSGTVHGAAADALALFDALSIQLLGALAPRGSERAVRAAAGSTSSLPALRSFLEGERLQRQGRWAEALESYRAAMTEDSTFALAHYRFNVASDWVGGFPVAAAQEALDRALRHSSALPEAERLLVEAWHHYRRADYSEAEFAYGRIVRDQPQHAEAWFRLGELRFHWSSAFGSSYLGAREAFERVHRHDPGDVPALIHLIRIAAAEGRREDTDALLRTLRALEPGVAIEREAELLRAFTFGGAEERAHAVEAIALQGPQRLLEAVRLVTSHSGNLAGAAELALAYRNRSPADPDKIVEAMAILASIELGRGRPGAARQAFAGHPSPAAPDFRALALTLPWFPASAAELAEARRALAALDGERWSLGVGDFLPRRVLLKGQLAVRAGDLAAAQAAQRQLRDAHGLQHPHDDIAHFYARILEAEILRARGRPAAALVALGSPVGGGSARGVFSYGLSQGRFLRATLLAENGRVEEALHWYGTFPDPDAFDAPWHAPSLRSRADLHELRGEPERAAELRAAAALLWRDAEPREG